MNGESRLTAGAAGTAVTLQQRRRGYNWTLGPSESCAPTVLPCNSIDAEFLAGTRDDTRAEVQLDGVVPRQRVGKCSSPARVALQVVIQVAIHGGAAAGVISSVQGTPHLSIEVVDRMSL